MELAGRTRSLGSEGSRRARHGTGPSRLFDRQGIQLCMPAEMTLMFAVFQYCAHVIDGKIDERPDTQWQPTLCRIDDVCG